MQIFVGYKFQLQMKPQQPPVRRTTLKILRNGTVSGTDSGDARGRNQQRKLPPQESGRSKPFNATLPLDEVVIKTVDDENVTVYKCKHCNKIMYRQSRCEEHQRGCDENPQSKVQATLKGYHYTGHKQFECLLCEENMVCDRPTRIMKHVMAKHKMYIEYDGDGVYQLNVKGLTTVFAKEKNITRKIFVSFASLAELNAELSADFASKLSETEAKLLDRYRLACETFEDTFATKAELLSLKANVCTVENDIKINSDAIAKIQTTLERVEQIQNKSIADIGKVQENHAVLEKKVTASSDPTQLKKIINDIISNNEMPVVAIESSSPATMEEGTRTTETFSIKSKMPLQLVYGLSKQQLNSVIDHITKSNKQPDAAYLNIIASITAAQMVATHIVKEMKVQAAENDKEKNCYFLSVVGMARNAEDSNFAPIRCEIYPNMSGRRARIEIHLFRDGTFKQLATHLQKTVPTLLNNGFGNLSAVC